MEQYEKGFQRFHAGEDVRPVTSCKFLLWCLKGWTGAWVAQALPHTYQCTDPLPPPQKKKKMGEGRDGIQNPERFAYTTDPQRSAQNCQHEMQLKSQDKQKVPAITLQIM